MAIQGPRAVWRFIARGGKRVGVTVAGFVLVVAGAIMLLTPGPGLLVIALGLVVLSSEYVWAERMLDKVKERSRDAYDRARRRMRRRPKPDGG